MTAEAEAMFSRWAIKRICKFLLKKKLGKFILGDVDLNQLDVQPSAGTVQLSTSIISIRSDPELIFFTDGASKEVMQILNAIIRGEGDGLPGCTRRWPC